MSEPQPATRLDAPYVGLSYFTEDHAELFFGRDAERTLIISNLRAAPLTILYADSGVGKSSLLRAGVAARIRELASRSLRERGSAGFIPVVFSSWRDQPVPDLIDEIERSIEPFVSGANGSLALRRDGLAAAIEDATEVTGSTLLVILDQFEEYFLYSSREQPPARFVDELADCVNRRDLEAHFLIAVREDAYAGVGDVFRGKVTNPYANFFNLEHLDRDAAREAIVRPVEHLNERLPQDARVTVEPALIDAVLDQVQTGSVSFDHEGRGGVDGGATNGRGESIETPYLQLVMSALWERERDDGSQVLRRSTLDELGGAQAIVRRHLDQAMSDLDSGEREAAVDVFNQLVTPSGTKIVHTVSDLAEYSDRDPAEVRSLVEKLTSGSQRILRPVPPAPGDDGQPRVEIFHDVLAPAILAWRQAQRSVRLERERAEAIARANRERRQARTFRVLTAVATVLLIVAVIAVVLARQESNRAHRAEHLAIARQLAAQGLADINGGVLARGVLLGLESYKYANTAASRATLVRAIQSTESMTAYLSGHTAYVSSVAYSPDGSEVASGSGDGSVLVQNVASGRTVMALRAGHGAVAALAFDPAGGLLATGNADGTVTLWSLAGHVAHQLSATAGGVDGVAFSPDGRLLAARGTTTLIVFDLSSGRVMSRLNVGKSSAPNVAFNPAGTLLATADGRDVLVWSPRTGARRLLAGHKAAINGVAFSPSGAVLASASDDRTVIVWNLARGKPLITLRGHTDAVNAVAFSPDGTMLASGGQDHDVILWSARSGMRLATFHGHPAPVESVAFSPSSAQLASGADDGQVIIWKARDALLEHSASLPAPAVSVAYSPTGALAASANGDGTVTIWDVRTWRALHVLQASSTPAESVAFSPDGRTLAAGTGDQTVVLYDAQTGARLHVLRGHGDVVYSVAFSPDGTTLASGSADTTAILWNARTGARERTLRGHKDFVYSVAFSPDGRTLATGSADKSVILWDVASGRLLRRLTGHTAAVESVSFSPDGRAVASASDDGSVILNDPRTGRQLGDPLSGETGSVLSVAFGRNPNVLASGGTDQSVFVWDLRSRLAQAFAGHTDSIQSVAFSPDGASVASAGLDQTVQVDGPVQPTISPAAVETRLCGVIRQNLTRAEWNEFLPGQAYGKICPGWP